MIAGWMDPSIVFDPHRKGLWIELKDEFDRVTRRKYFRLGPIEKEERKVHRTNTTEIMWLFKFPRKGEFRLYARANVWTHRVGGQNAGHEINLDRSLWVTTEDRIHIAAGSLNFDIYAPEPKPAPWWQFWKK